MKRLIIRRVKINDGKVHYWLDVTLVFESQLDRPWVILNAIRGPKKSLRKRRK